MADIAQDSYLFDDTVYHDAAAINLASKLNKTMFKRINTPFGEFVFDEDVIHKKDKIILEKMSLAAFEGCVIAISKVDATHICLYPNSSYPFLRQTIDGYVSLDKDGTWKRRHIPQFIESEYLVSKSAINDVSLKLNQRK